MPVVNTGMRTGGNQPSCFDKVKIGFMMGFGIGVITGSLFGGFASLRIGMRGAELLKSTLNRGLQGGGTFGTFMAIGSGIRC